MLLPPSDMISHADLAHRTRLPVAIALAVGVVAQITLPMGRTGIALTLSDLVVAVALPLVALELSRGRLLAVKALVPRLEVWLALATVALVIAYCVGLSQIGFQGWAATRVIGWLVVLGHLAVAAWIAADAVARRLAMQTFVVAAAAAISVDFAGILMNSVFVEPEKCSWVGAAMGFSQNPNAYAFMLLMALTVSASQAPRGLFGGPVLNTILFAVLAFALTLTSSRSAWAAAIIVIAIVLVLGRTRRMPLVLGAAIGAAFAYLLVSTMVCATSSAIATDVAALRNIVTAPAAIDAPMEARLYTHRQAIELFQSHPLFGAGIGTFLANHVNTPMGALVIHSTPLWLLGETGLLGVATFAALAVATVIGLTGQLRTGPPDVAADAATALLLLLGFAIMAEAQELLYQRSLWILLGLFAFRPDVPAPWASAERAAAGVAAGSNSA